MARQEDPHVFSGLQQDMAVSKCPAQYLIDAHNIRITRRDNGTLLTITNEKGTSYLSKKFIGTCLGHAVLNNQLVVFTTDNGTDRIYKAEITQDNCEVTCLYEGSLGFDVSYPIETLPYYENNMVQKVYWTDNKNQPRMINIATDEFKRTSWDDTSFDFVPELKLEETVTVEKKASEAGYFKAGTIQYAFSYYNLYGQESNIFYTTKLYYTSFYDRAGEVDQMVSNAFTITINNIDARFDYVRVYSIQRNAQDTPPLAKIVADVKIEKGGKILNDTRTAKWAYATHGALQYATDGVHFSDVNLQEGTIVPIFFAGMDRNFLKIDAHSTDFVLRTPERDLRTSANFFYIMVNPYKDFNEDQGDTRYILAADGPITVEGEQSYHMLQNTQDIELFYKGQDSISITDNGIHGETIDPSKLLFIGGEDVLIYTMTHKDGTLFMGNIKINRPSIPAQIKDSICSLRSATAQSYMGQISYAQECVGCYQQQYQLTKISESPYPYYTGLHINTSGFKHGEYYRLGLQFQYKNGKWSEPCWVGDFQQSQMPKLEDNGILDMPSFFIYLSKVNPYTPQDSCMRIQQELISLGYKKVRGVVVVPQKEERTILCQGVGNPTLYTDKERKEDSATVYAYSSWFFRAMNKTGCCIAQNEGSGITTGGGVSPQSRGTLMNLFKNTLYPDEIAPSMADQRYCRSYAYGNGVEMSYDNITAGANNVNKGENMFKIDWSFLTLNSPDLEFTEYFYNADFTGAFVYDIGRIPIDNTMADIFVQTSTPRIADNASGFVHTSIIGSGSCGIVSLPCYNDSLVSENFQSTAWGGNFMCLLWNPETSLNNDMARTGIDIIEQQSEEEADDVSVTSHGAQSALLEFKKVSNLRISNNTYYKKSNKATRILENTFNSALSSIVFYGDKEPIISKVNNKIYYGNVDKAMTSTSPLSPYFVGLIQRSFNNLHAPDVDFTIEVDRNQQSTTKENISAEKFLTVWYPGNSKFEKAWFTVDSDGHIYKVEPSGIGESTGLGIGGKYKGLLRKKKAGRIRFRSAPHIVMELPYKYVWDSAQNDNYYGENIIQYNGEGDYIMYPGSSSEDYPIDIPEGAMTEDSFLLPMLEVRKPKSDNMFGGSSPEALLKNMWIPAGEPVKLDSSNSIQIKFTEGDTWYQRYDCLKTQAYSKEDKNQVIEILSFMVETHVNLEGRYDRNRGQINNTNMSSINFNLMNPAYTQLDNFFNYKVLQEDSYKLNEFPTQFTWSLQKQIGSEIDDWTNVNLATSYNTDGRYGDITNLVTWNDKIFCFQRKGISQVLFNSRVQIPTSDNVPIEITNNYKVDGVSYLSDTLGSDNKWAVCSTSAALYFIDAMTKDLYSMGGQGMTNLSVSKNMSLWFRNLMSGESKPNNYTVRLFHDRQYGDLYIMTEGESLVFSEILGEFTSFMSYKNLPMLENIENGFYALNQKDLSCGMYKMFDGSYNMFFDNTVPEPYDITFVSNGVGKEQNLSSLDKIFTNLEVETDFWNTRIRDEKNKNFPASSEYPLPQFSFSNIRIWNEYQDSGDIELKKLILPSNLKKKFRIWRIQLPRNKKFNQDTHRVTGIMDRIRNPWCKIKLSNVNPGTNAMQLHQLDVSYFI